MQQKLKVEHHHQLDSAILNYKEESEIIFCNLINTEDIMSLQKLALDAKDSTIRDKYRQKLYHKLEPLYHHLKKFGIKQLHFHFPDTTSFLRMHKPLKYGDNLTKIRYSLVLANKTLKKVSGFEKV